MMCNRFSDFNVKSDKGKTPLIVLRCADNRQLFEGTGKGNGKAMTVKSIQEAWDEVNKIFPYDYEKDETASKNAGYPVYYSTASDHQNNWISDLGNRLEVNFEDGRSVNVWINSEEYHHFEVTVSGKSHNFSYVCSTIYEALDAVVDAGITFNFDVDTTELMLKLASMETDKLISFETHRFGVRRKAGEV